MRKRGVTWSVTSVEKKHENEGLLDSVTSATDEIVVVGSVSTESVLFLYLRVVFARTCRRKSQKKKYTSNLSSFPCIPLYIRSVIAQKEL